MDLFLGHQIYCFCKRKMFAGINHITDAGKYLKLSNVKNLLVSITRLSNQNRRYISNCKLEKKKKIYKSYNIISELLKTCIQLSIIFQIIQVIDSVILIRRTILPTPSSVHEPQSDSLQRRFFRQAVESSGQESRISLRRAFYYTKHSLHEYVSKHCFVYPV